MPITSFALAAALALAPASAAYTQSAAIEGVVVDARTGRPLPAVRVSIEHPPRSVETDGAGRFRLDVPPGPHVLVASLVGYALARHRVDASGGAPSALRIVLSEGAGAYEEHVTVSAAASPERGASPGAASLFGRDLQALRGVTLDDPLRTVHALPSAAATDDFYSEFAVRGSPFRHVGLTVDGIPTRYLMHAVHGVSDGGSIAMINSDAVESVSLMPGSYPQQTGRHLGAQVDIRTRDGSRDALHGRAGLSGTSATVLLEGPLRGGRGSWLVSARRSYLDLLLERIDDGGSFGFGFTDVEAKLVFDASPRHQVQWLAIGGTSGFDEDLDNPGANDEARVDGRSWLTALTWRFAPSSRLALTQRVYATGLVYDARNEAGGVLDDALSAETGWRGDAAVAAMPGVLLEFGADAQRLTGRHVRRRSLDGQPAPSLLDEFRASGPAASAFAQAAVGTPARLHVTPGVRIDYWGPTETVTGSPWVTAGLSMTPGTRVTAGAGVYRQFPDFEQLHGVSGGGDALRPETARHVDLAVSRRMPLDLVLQAGWFARDERDVLWIPGSEPRRLADGSIQPGRGDAPWKNSLEGRARGVEIVLRRDAPSGLSGWAGYAYGRHRYRDTTTGEAFWADHDQRHALSLFGHYRVSSRTTVGARFRYGSNYPLRGYIGEQPVTPGAPALFGGERPLFYGLATSRNTLRLPAYARLDVRLDRTFTWRGRRVTVFAEVANALNRTNVRNVPYGVDHAGRVLGPTGSLMPIVPSAGFLVDF